MKTTLLTSVILFFSLLFGQLSFAQGNQPCNTSQPRPITGNQHPCPGSIETYCIQNDRGYTSFEWDVPRAQAGNPPIGWEIISGQGTSCVTVRVGTKSGTMKVKVTDPVCGTKVATLPVKPANGFSVDIAGPDTVCFDEEQVFTAIVSDSIKGNGNSNGANQGNFTYTWTVPTDWIIVSGQGTQTLTVIPGFESGQVSVSTNSTATGGGKGNNGNGVGGSKGYCNNTASDAMDVFVSEDCGLINPLPVELLGFDGKTTSEGIALSWSTATEKNNDKFEVQRSADGRSFETIGTVKGNGTTASQQAYNFTDKRPASGLNYFRLRQVDFDGTAEFSKVISVSAKAKGEKALTLYPNPTTGGEFNVRITPSNEVVTLQVTDLSGKVLHSREVKNTSEVNINGSSLGMKPGIYLVSLKAGKNVSVEKLIMR